MEKRSDPSKTSNVESLNKNIQNKNKLDQLNTQFYNNYSSLPFLFGFSAGAIGWYFIFKTNVLKWSNLSGLKKTGVVVSTLVAGNLLSAIMNRNAWEAYREIRKIKIAERIQQKNAAKH